MDQERTRRQKNYILMRSIRDYGMGVLLLCIGFYFFFSKKITGREIIEDVWLRYMILILFTLYGGFRIYRGYAKNYFNKNEE